MTKRLTELLQERHRDAYLAIGRYVVEFSQLVQTMRSTLETRIFHPEDSDTSLLAEFAFGEASANQITNTFFAACQELGELDSDEKKVGRALRARVLTHIERRNDIAHGDWWVTPVAPWLTRTKPAKAKGIHHLETPTIAEMHGWSEELASLTGMVGAYGTAALRPTYVGKPPPRAQDSDIRVRDLFAVKGKQLLHHGLPV